MTCSRFEDQISDYIDGEAGPGMRKEMDAHVGACPECAKMMRSMVGLTDRLSRMPRVQPTAGFDFALRSRLSMEISREMERSERLWSRFREVSFLDARRLALAVAAVLVVASSSLYLAGVGADRAPLQTADSSVALPPPSEVMSLTVDRGALKRLSEKESFTISDHRLHTAGSLTGGVRRPPTVQRVAVRF